MEFVLILTKTEKGNNGPVLLDNYIVLNKMSRQF